MEKIRRTSGAGADAAQDSISRVRSMMLIVIAFASPTMLIATIRKPRMPIVVVSDRLAAICRASSARISVPTS